MSGRASMSRALSPGCATGAPPALAMRHARRRDRRRRRCRPRRAARAWRRSARPAPRRAPAGPRTRGGGPRVRRATARAARRWRAPAASGAVLVRRRARRPRRPRGAAGTRLARGLRGGGQHRGEIGDQVGRCCGQVGRDREQVREARRVQERDLRSPSAPPCARGARGSAPRGAGWSRRPAARSGCRPRRGAVPSCGNSGSAAWSRKSRCRRR